MDKNAAAAQRPPQKSRNLPHSLIIIAVAVIVLALYLITGQPTKAGNVVRDGWAFYSGEWYYYEPDGSALTGTQVIDGKTEVFDESGIWIQTLE